MTTPPITVVEADRPEEDTPETRRQLLRNALTDWQRSHFDRQYFVECDACAAEPGAKVLCNGCIANRETVGRLQKASRANVAAYLRDLRDRPRVFAYTREAFVAHVSMLLELSGVAASAWRTFLHKHFKVPGTCAVNVELLVAEVDDAWARAFVEEAATLALLDINTSGET